MQVTDEMVAVFKAAWEKADEEGRSERSRIGLQAVADWIDAGPEEYSFSCHRENMPGGRNRD